MLYLTGYFLSVLFIYAMSRWDTSGWEETHPGQTPLSWKQDAVMSSIWPVVLVAALFLWLQEQLKDL